MRKSANKEAKKKKLGTKILMIIILLALIGVGIFFGYKYMNEDKTKEVGAQGVTEENTTVEPEPEKTVQIYAGTERPIACMIDNHSDAWPQFAINEAYAVYEIIVEGGETRLMAVFKGSNADKVGPMRSSRHYFLDYALENDAIYAHIGWSPQAQSDIRTLGVNNVNGLEYDTGRAWKEGDVFWRLSNRYAPHNSICDLATIKTAATSKGYRTTSDAKSVLNYVTEEVTLEENPDAISATNVKIPFSNLQSVTFEYNETTGRYTRYARGKAQTDATDSTNITTKNIIITKAENYTLSDGENKGRQGLKNTGTKDGYYITNGKAIPITCTKSDRSSKTVYKNANGEEIDVNDGNTFFEICPVDTNITIQ